MNLSVHEAWGFVHNISNGVQIPIDVRSSDAFRSEHVDPQSDSEITRWFGEELFSRRLPLLFFKIFFNEQDVIVYSQNGEDSLRVAQVLVDHKFSGTVYHMIGGMDAWKNAGLPTISS